MTRPPPHLIGLILIRANQMRGGADPGVVTRKHGNPNVDGPSREIFVDLDRFPFNPVLPTRFWTRLTGEQSYFRSGVSMKAVILAAGYGTRLQRDVAADTSGRFAHLVGIAKPLLPVGRRALVSHWVRSLTACGCVDRIYVVVSGVTRVID